MLRKLISELSPTKVVAYDLKDEARNTHQVTQKKHHVFLLVMCTHHVFHFNVSIQQILFYNSALYSSSGYRTNSRRHQLARFLCTSSSCIPGTYYKGGASSNTQRTKTCAFELFNVVAFQRASKLGLLILDYWRYNINSSSLSLYK